MLILPTVKINKMIRRENKDTLFKDAHTLQGKNVKSNRTSKLQIHKIFRKMNV